LKDYIHRKVGVEKDSHMPNYIEKAEELTLPVVVLHGNVAFPSAPINVEISDDASLAAAEAASASDSFVLLLTEYNKPPMGNPAKDLCRVGTVARIKQFVKEENGDARMLAEGFSRASVVSFREQNGYTLADALCKTVILTENGGIRGEAAVRSVFDSAQHILRFLSAGGEAILQSGQLRFRAAHARGQSRILRQTAQEGLFALLRLPLRRCQFFYIHQIGVLCGDLSVPLGGGGELLQAFLQLLTLRPQHPLVGLSGLCRLQLFGGEHTGALQQRLVFFLSA
jgi:hypothetical protein